MTRAVADAVQAGLSRAPAPGQHDMRPVQLILVIHARISSGGPHCHHRRRAHPLPIQSGASDGTYFKVPVRGSHEAGLNALCAQYDAPQHSVRLSQYCRIRNDLCKKLFASMQLHKGLAIAGLAQADGNLCADCTLGFDVVSAGQGQSDL